MQYGGPQYPAPPPGFGPPGGGFGGVGGPRLPGQGGVEVNTTLPLVISIVSCLCCGLSFVGGVIGIVLSLQAKTAKEHGDMEVAQKKARLALILPIACWFVNDIVMAILWHKGVIVLP